MLKSIYKNGITLAIFAAITTFIVSLVNNFTQEKLQDQTKIQQKKLFNQILPSNLYNNDIQKECYSVIHSDLGDTKPHSLYIARKNNKLIAAVLDSSAPDGYSGIIKILVAINLKGKILGVRVIDHHETPGLGDKIDLRISNWITKFQGKIINFKNNKNFAIKKDGGIFDQFTGATITPQAVVNATKRTSLLMLKLLKNISSISKYRCIMHNE